MPEQEHVEFETPLRQRVVEPAGPTRRMLMFAERVATVTPPIAGIAALLFRPDILDAGNIGAGLLVSLASLGAHFATDTLFRTRTTYYVGDTSDRGLSVREVENIAELTQKRGNPLIITSDKAKPWWRNRQK